MQDSDHDDTGAGAGASRSGGKFKAPVAKSPASSKKSRADSGDDDAGSDAPADDGDDDAGPRLRAARGGRPAPTPADKVAQAARVVANTLAAEVAAKKEADRAAHAMQTYKDNAANEVKWVLTSVRAKVAEAVGGYGLSHTDTIKFLNSCSKGFAVRRARAPHAQHARALTPRPATRRCGPRSSTRKSRVSLRRLRARRLPRPRRRLTRRLRRLLGRLVPARARAPRRHSRRGKMHAHCSILEHSEYTLYIFGPLSDSVF